MLAPELLVDQRREQVREDLRFVSMFDKLLSRRDLLQGNKTKDPRGKSYTNKPDFKDDNNVDDLINVEDLLTNNLKQSTKLKEYIKRSNLILISLGFNDLFKPLLKMLLKVLDLTVKKLNNYKIDLALLSPSLVRTMELESKELSENLLYLINAIRRLNPKAELVFLSYPLSSLYLLTGFFDAIIKIFSER